MSIQTRGLQCVLVAMVAFAEAVWAFPEERPFSQTFIMDEVQDGKRVNDYFELWSVSGNLKAARPWLSIVALSFATRQGRTHLFTWTHDARSVRPAGQPIGTTVKGPGGAYIVHMNGRLSACSGLIVFVILDKNNRISSLHGNMKAGSQCQSESVFEVDKSSESRQISPIWNPKGH